MATNPWEVVSVTPIGNQPTIAPAQVAPTQQVGQDPWSVVSTQPLEKQNLGYGEMFSQAASNIPSSASNMASGLYHAVTNPVQTVSNLLDVGAGALQKALPKPLVDFVNQFESNPEASKRAVNMANAIGGMYKDRYGSVEGIKNTIATDPVGAMGDLSLLLSGGASVASKTPALTKLASALQTGSEYTNPINLVSKPIGAVINPNVAPEVKSLMKEGVTPTTGQILGGGYKRFEEGLTSIPIVGDFIKNAQLRAVEDLNQAAFNRALKPIGFELPKNVVGREAVQFVSDKLDDAYGKLLPNMTVKTDSTFKTELANLRGMVQSGAIDPNAVKAFDRFLDTNVVNKFQGQNAISGETLKNIQSDLREQITRFGKSTDADQQLIAQALKEVQDQFRQLVIRTNPQNAKELKAIDTGYANFKRVQDAASRVGAEEGVFSPAQLQGAVRSKDTSKDKAQFAKGTALMQDLSESGKTVLGSKVPDSGTPYRTMAALLTGGGTAMAGYPAIAGGLLTAPIMYSSPGQNLMATLLAKRPAGAQATSDFVKNNQQAKLAALLAAQSTPRIELNNMLPNRP
jgi:hypothetical protein